MFKTTLLCRYTDKLTDFLRSFVASHLGRFDSSNRFPVIELLSLLFKYTFLQLRPESFCACLDAWTMVVDYVTNALANNRGLALVGKPPLSSAETSPTGAGGGSLRLLARYHEALLALTAEVLARMQFRIDHASRPMLEELDDSSLDDDVRQLKKRFLVNER